MMSQKTVIDSSYYLRVFRGDVELYHNISNFVPGETLQIYMHGPKKLNHIVIEARNNAIFEHNGKCSLKSRTNVNGSSLLLPSLTGSEGLVSIAAVWANSYSGGVKLSNIFVLYATNSSSTATAENSDLNSEPNSTANSYEDEL